MHQHWQSTRETEGKLFKTENLKYYAYKTGNIQYLICQALDSNVILTIGDWYSELGPVQFSHNIELGVPWIDLSL